MMGTLKPDSRAAVGVFMPFYSPMRGGPDVTAMWLVQSLCCTYSVTLVTTRQFDLRFFNQFAGTSLTHRDFRICHLPSLPCLPSYPMCALQGPLFQHFARRCAASFDVCINAMNCRDFGVPGVQFLADLDWLGTLAVKGTPTTFATRSWDRRPTHLRRLYHHMCRGLYAESGRDQLHEDLLVSNSEWIAAALRSALTIDSPTIYPPVPALGSVDDLPWEGRRHDFVWIGRIAPSKRLESAISIVGRLRAAGLACKLHIVGKATDKDYEAHVRQIARSRDEWTILEGPMYGTEKAQFLAQFRYALHTRADEPFGITLVELIKSGCVVFGPNSCGSAEILSHEGLLFGTEEEAARKILDAVAEPHRIERFRRHLEDRAKSFSADRFCSSVQRLIAEFLEEKATKRLCRN